MAKRERKEEEERQSKRLKEQREALRMKWYDTRDLTVYIQLCESDIELANAGVEIANKDWLAALDENPRFQQKIDALVQMKTDAEAKLKEAKLEKEKAEAKLEKEKAEAKLEKEKAEAKLERVEAKLEKLEDRIAAAPTNVALQKELEELREAKRSLWQQLYPAPPPSAAPASEPPALASISFEEFDQWLAQHPVTPQVSAYHGAAHAEMQRTLLGPFHKEGEEGMWPITGRDDQWHLDLELLPSLLDDNNPLRPSARALLQQLGMEHRYTLMLAVSGGGKTSAFADIARQTFVLYIQCTAKASEANIRQSRGYDQGFVDVLERLKSVLDNDQEKNATEGKRLFVMEICCRLAQLYSLVKAKSDLSSFEYYVHQRNVGDSWLYHAREQFANLTLYTYQVLVEQMYKSLVEHLGASRLVIAVDEIEAAAGSFVNHFDPDHPEKHKGFLSPLIAGLTCLERSAKFRVILTGTAFGLDRAKTIRSSLNKGEKLSVLNSIPKRFPPVTLSACRKLFHKLNIGDEDIRWDEVSETRIFDRNFTLESLDIVNVALEPILEYFVIGSRFRTLIRIVHHIAVLQKECDPNQKRATIRAAVIESLGKFRRDITRHFRVVATSRTLHPDLQDVYMEYFSTIWTSMCLNGGRAFILKSSAERDLMMLGVGNFEAVSAETGYFVVTEFLVADSIRFFLEELTPEGSGAAFRRALAAFERIVRVHKNVPARGTILEEVLFRALCNPEFQGKLVSDLPFVQPFEAKRRDAEAKRNNDIRAAKQARKTRSQVTMAEQPLIVLDPWWTRTSFCATDTTFAHQLALGMSTASFLASSNSHGVVYSPETVARPDGVLMLDSEHAMVLGATIWSGTVPSDKIHSQIRSTDLSKTFFTADGLGVNPNCTTQRAEWESNGLNKIQAVRVHIALPSFAAAAPEGEPIASQNDLGVHLDRTNCHLLFGEDEDAMALYDVLAIATGTKRDLWKSPPE